MKGDFTRDTFRPRKHYSGVRMQQGRVQLDADWNEQIDIAARRVETETVDVVGRYGVPWADPGFAIGGGAFPSIGKGHLYLDGFLVENDNDVLVTGQDEFLFGYTPTKTAGEYIAYLDVWQRHVTALEDSLIREVALGGPDTATRTQTVWQVRLLGPLTAPLTCATEPTAWQQLVGFTPGKLRARTAPGTTPANLCEVPAGAGYRRLENQLYRVEIHTPGPRGTARFKWSRDNGAIVTSWTSQDGKDLIVTSAGRDEVLGFAAGQYVELTDDDRELRGEAGVLVKLSKVEGQVLTLDPSAPAVDRSAFGRNPKIRRWDSEGEVPTGGNWVALEDGVEVFFESGCDYKIGDYWMIPARTAKATVEWPADETNPSLPAAVVRQGIEHHYCRLATLHSDGTTFTVTGDCRPKFPPLTMLTGLYYVGGDSQETMPGLALPRPLEVRVACGSRGLANATVRFAVEAGVAGRLAKSLEKTGTEGAGEILLETDENGVARCFWMPAADPNAHSQQVTAALVEADGNLVLNASGQPQEIHFTGRLSLAGQVAYEAKSCLGAAPTVGKALDQLCEKVSDLANRILLSYVGGDGQETSPGGRLPQPLQVRVTRGGVPLKDAWVVFQIEDGTGSLAEAGGGKRDSGRGSGLEGPEERRAPGRLLDEKAGRALAVQTDHTGLASCSWTLDDSSPSQRASASLAREASGRVISRGGLLEAGEKASLDDRSTIYFNANLETAAEQAQEFRILRVAVENRAKKYDLINGADVLAADLAASDSHIAIYCSDVIDAGAVSSDKPVCFVAIDVPALSTDAFMMGGAIGHQSVRLLFDAFAKGNIIYWSAKGRAREWLNALAGKWPELRVPARLVVRGNFIWAERENRDASLRYLDGNSFGIPAAGGGTLIAYPSGDGQRGGDFETWFWLAATLPDAPPVVSGGLPGLAGILVDVTRPTAGTDLAVTVQLDEAAPAGGVEVEISGTGAALDAPAKVFIPAGEKEAVFNIKANEVNESTKATLYASLGGAKRQRTITVQPRQ